MSPSGSRINTRSLSLWDRGNLVSAPAPEVVVKDTVGAGDAFMAGLMVGLTRGANSHTVLETACRLGSIVASHEGATPLLPQEIIHEFRANLKAKAPSEDNPVPERARERFLSCWFLLAARQL